MKFFDSMENMLGKYLEPLSVRISDNNVIKAIVRGCIATVPITIGVSLITILINLPIPSWAEFLNSTGIFAAGTEVTNVTLSMLPIYLISAVSYSYCKIKGESGIVGPMIALAVFLILMPSTISMQDGSSIVALTSDYLGSKGIFLALILGVTVAIAYNKLINSRIRIKMPDSVPPMVSDSLSASIPAIIIFFLAFVVKVLFNFTEYNNVFDAFNTIIQTPVMAFGTSPISFIFFTVLCNLLWFFGVHPAAITGLYAPIIVGAIVANMQAFVSGSALPYPALMVVYLICNLGGFGGTLGLSLCLLLAKSEKFKSVRKLFIIPNIFNINEPMVFGMPTVMNPIYFFPMVFSQFITGWIALGLYSIFQFPINPTYQLGFPWVTPPVITAFAEGGVLFFGIAIIAILIQFLCYYPFFRLDDKKACKMEKETSIVESDEFVSVT